MSWQLWAVIAAVLYGLHQVFTKLASDRISDGLGGLVVEGTATLAIGLWLVFLAAGGHWDQKATRTGIAFSALTGICVGAGTIAFFRIFQKGGPLSSIPAVLAGGATVMAIAGMVMFREPPNPRRIGGIALSLAGLWLLRK